ncbi:Tulp2 [Symbiodinium natans]|uniref:Tulp2 protein n=1 Tax=Symbiodinium natans TaxID=878477 RepID=A0A812RC59_9DINO|nr:Tulp2 [Symbiodinium natans]
MAIGGASAGLRIAADAGFVREEAFASFPSRGGYPVSQPREDEPIPGFADEFSFARVDSGEAASWQVLDVDSESDGVDSQTVNPTSELGLDSSFAAQVDHGSAEVATNVHDKARSRRKREFFEHLLSFPAALNHLTFRHDFAAAVLGPGAGTLRGRVEVLRAGVLKRPRYGLYVRLAQEGGVSDEVMLMAAERQQQRTFGPYYVISANALDFDRESPCFLGRLTGNAMCTQYLLHGQRASGALREELCAVRFRKPSDAPRSMHVVLPSSSSAASFSARNGQEGMLLNAAAGSASRENGLNYLVSPSSTWDATRKVYRMNFHGRVHCSSSKNFQLVQADSSFKPEQPDALAMQFGRIDGASFALDAAFPLSPLQAFSIALSVFDNRLYEALRIYY